MLLERPCPICGCITGNKLTNIEFAPYQNDNLPSEFNISACDNCNFVFDDIKSSQDEFDKYYLNTNKYIVSGTCGSGDFSQSDIERYENSLVA